MNNKKRKEKNNILTIKILFIKRIIINFLKLIFIFVLNLS